MLPLVFAIVFPAFVHLHLLMTSILILLFHSAGAANASDEDGAPADEGATADVGDEGEHYLPACHIILCNENVV